MTNSNRENDLSKKDYRQSLVREANDMLMAAGFDQVGRPLGEGREDLFRRHYLVSALGDKTL